MTLGPDVVASIRALLETSGAAMYAGEPVTQREHALQCAWLAEQERAPDVLVIAALLHDIGHLLHGGAEDVAARGRDARHEDVGQRWLEQFFGPEVTEPVRLHVDAKRYLCGSDPVYAASLSPASRQSLALQGGPFSETQAADFLRQPFAQNAVHLRRWDDRAKVPGLRIPGFTHYAAKVRSLVLIEKG